MSVIDDLERYKVSHDGVRDLHETTGEVPVTETWSGKIAVHKHIGTISTTPEIDDSPIDQLVIGEPLLVATKDSTIATEPNS